jgi:hypothetical protein
MMTHLSSQTVPTGSEAEAHPVAVERRLEPRTTTHADLWMVDHQGATILRCQCVDISETGMRLHVPLGYGVVEGQRYEIRSRAGGYAQMLGMDDMRRRWATVVRARVHFGSTDDHLEIGVVLDCPEGDTFAPSAPFVGMV